ncbi:putative molybdenum cofactor guanylyltransferase [bacterium HR15]|nr:putative molybdenum cofactor guanylyltransferase [bacterium HR15]
MNLTGAVLAGGRSQRFGQPKATFKLRGKPLLLYTLDALQPICTERVVVAKPDTPLPSLPPTVRLLYDEFETQHPLSGILTVLHHANCEWVFICAVDMPFLNPALLQWMATLSVGPMQEYDVIVPESEGRLQPLHAFYWRKSLEKLRAIVSDWRMVLPASRMPSSPAPPFESEGRIEANPYVCPKKHPPQAAPPSASREDTLATEWLPSLQAILRHPSLRVRVLTPDEWRIYDPEGRSFANLNMPP